MLIARPAYHPPQQPFAYDPLRMRNQLNAIARALLITSGETVRAAYTVEANDFVILADATTAPFTVTFPPADQVQFGVWVVLKKDASANAVTLGGTFSGSVNPTLGARYAGKILWTDGVDYYILATV